MELATADHARLKREGRSFNCETCPEKVKQVRRCYEDREDFTEADGSIWPMTIEPGGHQFGFCPAKAAWDAEAMGTFRLLGLAAETGTMYEAGGLSNQPDWFIDLASWFIPLYKQRKIIMFAKAVIGDGKSGG
jgi:hypothetical protein